MTRQEKANYILSELEDRYPNPPIPLAHKDHYTLLIAVLLSARCTDAKVNQVTPALFQLADNPVEMAKEDPETVKAIIRPCGLSPQKSKAIVETSKILANQYNGKVPHTFEELEALPGVGHKTASVVMAQAFNTPAFPVDTHIHRLATRWKLTSGKSTTQTERDLKKTFPKESWIKLHLQIIYYAREHCTSRSCDGFSCPICRALNLKD